jgi:transposase InsO family protein
MSEAMNTPCIIFDTPGESDDTVTPVTLWSDNASSVPVTGIAELSNQLAVSQIHTPPLVLPRAPLGDSIVSINLDKKTIILEESFGKDQMQLWVRQVRHPHFQNLDHHDFISESGKRWINMSIQLSTTLDRNAAGDVDWKILDKETLCVALIAMVSDVTTGLAADKTLLEKVKAFVVTFDLESINAVNDCCFKLATLHDEHALSSTAAEQAECYSILVKKLPDKWKSHYENPPCFQSDSVLKIKGSTIIHFTTLLLQMNRLARSVLRMAESLGATIGYSAATRCSSSDGTRIQKRNAQTDDTDSSTNPGKTKQRTLVPGFTCYGCGHVGHAPKLCPSKAHPDFNKEAMPFVQSTKGLLYKARGLECLPLLKEAPQKAEQRYGKPSGSSSSSSNWKNKKGEIEDILASLSSASSANLLRCYVSSPLQRDTARSKIFLDTLIDTGSLAGNFISASAVSRSRISFAIMHDSKRVCSGLDNSCIILDKSIELFVHLRCDNNLTIHHSFKMKFFLLEDSPVDLIIGRDSIKEYDLFSYVPSQITRTVSPRRAELQCRRCTCPEILASSEHASKEGENDTSFEPSSASSEIQASLVDRPDQAITSDTTSYEDTEGTGAFEPFLTSTSPEEPDLLSLIHISGSPAFRKQIMDLCIEFRSLFSNSLSKTPAKIKPFELVVDASKWQVPANREAPRRLSPEKQAEVLKQVTELLGMGVIEKSNASYYSQILLVPKPGTNVWRMCVDYRNMNSCTEPASWPIPNIDAMFRRIGARCGKYFGTTDLVLGYHQASVAKGSRIFTAFILWCGIFQFTRLPFGPKRAPSYFQEQMASVVLAGLLYFICEVYLDDITIYGATENEFILNLRTVFVRLVRHNILLKPAKTYLGYEEVEWVGKIVSSEGLKMSRKRTQGLLDFPRPITFKHLKSFLGLVNYFRDFIRHHSMTVKPLHGLLTNYHKSSKVTWTPETIQSFEDTKASVRTIPTLCFLNDTDPITLCTDASDYGAGGYLYQTVDGVDKPIAFLSKAFVGTQLKWSTIQKEAYAIFYCCKELQHLLSDRKFRILTDHRNLLYLKTSSNPVIVRWAITLSELDFTLGFIAGTDNIVADSMSRLCENHMHEIDSVVAPLIDTQHISASVIEKFDISQEHHDIIAAHHNTMVGHMGVRSTLKRLTASNHMWPQIRQHVKHFVRHCPICQKLSAVKFPTHAHPFTTSTYEPMQCLNIDFIGPFPDGGYILTIIDTFTRWIELYSTPDATAVSATNCLLKHFGRFGAPAQIRSDNGPHFTAEVFDSFLATVGVHHCRTLPYSSQENSLVERSNKEINRHVRAFTYDNNTLDSYADSLPFVQRILNANYSDRLKVSAAELLFGKMLDLDSGLFVPREERIPSSPDETISSYMEKLLAMQDSILTIARDNSLLVDSLHMASKSTTQYEFEIGSHVLVRYQSGTPPTRLHTIWKGPLRVLRVQDSTYTLLDLVTNKENRYHVSYMKPFIFDPLEINPADVARHDYLEFFVENIVAHRGDFRNRKALSFKVKWLGYDHTHDTWEPYSNLRDVKLLHEYLTSHKMQSLIPPRFR